MQYDAIILAGGENSRELRNLAPYDNEALILIGQYPMIFYVYQALRASVHINNIVISGPVEAVRNLFAKEDKLFFVDSGSSAVDTLMNGVKFLQGLSITEKILILPTDIPFITTEAIDDFLRRSELDQADFYYPLISQMVNEEKFPGVSRTYVKLKEGVFTGGNLFILKTEHINDMVEMAQKLVQRRKNPLAIAGLFGFRVVWKYLFRRMNIYAAEQRFQVVTGFKGKAIISPYAEVGIDVDKPSDLELAQRYLGQAGL